jgi:hypothetical protein
MPDLVVANAEENRPEDVEQLRANGVPVWVTSAAASVPAGLASVRRLLTQGLGLTQPEWLVEAEQAWSVAMRVRMRAIIPIWRRPWIVLGRDTFAGDVLLRLGVANVFSDHHERYPRPRLAELHSQDVDLVVLPDEPYRFTESDGPEAFPRMPCVLVNGRLLTWCGPSLVEAHETLVRTLAT